MAAPTSTPNILVPQRAPKKSGWLIQAILTLGLLVLSIGIAFLVYIPYINEINDLRAKQTELRTQIADLQTKYKTINDMGVNKTGEYLTAARKYVPDDIRLAELATFINLNAQKYNLVVSRLNLSESKIDVRRQININISTAITGKNQEILLGEIQGPFTLSGSKEKVFEFLDFLVSGGYATNFDRVAISPSNNGVWTVSFVAVHHFLAPAKNVPALYPLIKPNLDLLEASSDATEN